MEVKQFFSESTKVHKSVLGQSSAVFTFVKCPDKEIESRKIEFPSIDDAKW